MKIKYKIDKILLGLGLVIFIAIGWIRADKQANIDNSHLLVDSSNEILDSTESETELLETTQEFIYVDISGCINNPNLYKLEAGARLKDLIDLAGGLCPNADVARINLASKLADEMKIHILELGEEGSQESDIAVDPTETSLVNINTASEDQLLSIPGIGPAKAREILNYRESKRFESIEDIKNISGIGDKTFEKLKDYITIN